MPNSDMKKNAVIIATWPKQQDDPFFDVLKKGGLDVLSMPLIEIRTLHFSLPRSISEYQWIVFTSKNGIRSFLKNHNFDVNNKIAVIGRSTADVLRGSGVEPHFVGSGQSGKYFASELEAVIPSQTKVLMVLGNLAPDLIKNYLANTRVVDRVDAYETSCPEHVDPGIQSRVKKGDYTLIAVSSPSIVGNLVQLIDAREASSLRVVSIGQATTAAAKELNIEPVTTAAHQSYRGLARAVLNYIEKNQMI